MIRLNSQELFLYAYSLSPVLIEAMTYRMGHHSTSDDSLKYRRSLPHLFPFLPFHTDLFILFCKQYLPFSSALQSRLPSTETDEIDSHVIDTPINRLNSFLQQQGVWSQEQDKQLREVRGLERLIFVWKMELSYLSRAFLAECSQ